MRARTVQIPNLAGIVAIAASSYHAVALGADGSLWGWGANASGQFGNGTTSSSFVPVQVKGINGVVSAATGGSHSVALKADGTVWAWGFGQFGAVGNGLTNTRELVPVQVVGVGGTGLLNLGK